MDDAHLLFRFEALESFLAERDRRYSSEAALRAEALRIKEEGDRRALELARDIQALKDEHNNRLREQIGQERGLYATHAELDAVSEKMQALIVPIGAYVAAQQGRSGGLTAGWGWIVAVIGMLIGTVGLAARFMGQ